VLCKANGKKQVEFDLLQVCRQCDGLKNVQKAVERSVELQKLRRHQATNRIAQRAMTSTGSKAGQEFGKHHPTRCPDRMLSIDNIEQIIGMLLLRCQNSESSC
jgi:hypothetical protein